MLQKIRANNKGFTLIELMIVIAIIGILAAIAIPNFIEYRNKAVCSAMESDAQAVAAAIADYFSDPANVTAPETTGTSYEGINMSPTNTVAVSSTTDGGYKIVVTETEATKRCKRYETGGYTIIL